MIGERIKAREGAAREGQAPAQHAAPRARAQRQPSASRWSATPTPASRRCSTRWSRRAPTPPTSSSPRSTRPRASSTSRTRGALGVAVGHGRLHPRPAAQAGRGVRGDAAGSGRRRPAAARRRRVEPAAGRADGRGRSACSTRSAPPTCRRSWSSTSSTGSKPRSARACCADASNCDAGVRVPRVFVSALTGEGLDELRRAIAQAVAGRATARSPAQSYRPAPTAQHARTTSLTTRRRRCRRQAFPFPSMSMSPFFQAARRSSRPRRLARGDSARRGAGAPARAGEQRQPQRRAARSGRALARLQPQAVGPVRRQGRRHARQRPGRRRAELPARHEERRHRRRPGRSAPSR